MALVGVFPGVPGEQLSDAPFRGLPVTASGALLPVNAVGCVVRAVSPAVTRYELVSLDAGGRC